MPHTSRRHFLKLAITAAAGLPFATRWFAGHAAERALAVSRTLFPQSVASGDPRPYRVLLWTRAPAADASVTVRLQVADDAQFTRLRVERELSALAEHDHCLRVRVEGLQPGQRYHYRFMRLEGGEWVSSPPGITRTAPAANTATGGLRFAFMSCQDYGGRWYNTLVPLLDQELDFILHLGDFIYESVGDASFQDVGGERSIRFTDEAGTLRIGKRGNDYLAAASLDNYRQLHREYRTDPVLQALLERAPLVAIWDDHEFSDDCWQDHATYLNGRALENDRARRRHAERAYFDYMPVDVAVGEAGSDGTAAVDEEWLHPHTTLWRRLDFGRDFRLIPLDYRSHRPDHPIPEDAFPGSLACDQPTLQRLLPRLGLQWEALAPTLMPYLELSEERWKPLRKPLQRALTRGYMDEGVDKRVAVQRATALSHSSLAVYVVRDVLRRYNEAVPGFMQVELPPAEDAAYPRGLPWLALGKSALFSHLGSRYMVVKDSYDLLLALRKADAQLPSALGEVQQAWLLQQLAQSGARWKFVASSVSMTPMVLDLADPALQAPELLRRKFYLNVDQWDGFAPQRDALVQAMDQAGGAVALSGDIHASFATQHSARTLEFTAPAVSSQTLSNMMAGAAKEDQANAEAGARLVAGLDQILAMAEPRIKHVQTTRHGVGIVALDQAGGLEVEFLLQPADACKQCLYDQVALLAEHGERVRFEVQVSVSGERSLRQRS